MNISLEQYRAAVGLHNATKIKAAQTNKSYNHANILSFWFDFLLSCNHSKKLLNFCVYFVIINYIFDLLHACVKNNTFYINSHPPLSSVVNGFGHHHQKLYFEKYRIILTCLFYCFLKFCFVGFPTSPKNKLKFIYKRLILNKLLDRIINTLSMLLLFINLTLISLTIPNIYNPGPINNVKVFYHNVRGFIDLKDNPQSPQLCTSKIKDFHGIVFSQKPEVIVLNETWLKKSILSSEIFPNNSYKVFRRDRSIKSHPPDLNSPNKFKRNGGGVLIAIRSDLNVESCKYKLSGGGGTAKAEIISVILKPKTGKNICITTLYRVGTLGAANIDEVTRHLRTLIKSKPNANHVFVGDFNLSKTIWPSGSINNMPYPPTLTN